MAKKKTDFNYAAAIRTLREGGPARVYLLYGPEDYLRECYLSELRTLCVPEENEFSLHRLDGQTMTLSALAEAVDAMPFFTERTMVEVRDYDLNRCRDADCERLKTILADVPDYCTLVFVQGALAEPDGRLAAVKAVKKAATAIEFTEQDAGMLTGWVCKRFRALGKAIERSDAEYLLFLSGSRMSALIPEIEKIAAHAAGDAVTHADIEATASRVPEAEIWRLTELMSQRKFDAAAALLGDLLGNKDNHPIFLNALIGRQLRQLYAVRCGLDAGRARRDLKELSGVNYDFALDKLTAAAKSYSAETLAELAALSAEYDYRMKGGDGGKADPAALLRELFARIAAVK